MGPGIGVYKTYGHSQCHQTLAVASNSALLHSQAEDGAFDKSEGQNVMNAFGEFS